MHWMTVFPTPVRRAALLAAAATVALAAPAVAGAPVKPKAGTYAGKLAIGEPIAVSLNVAHGKLANANISNIPIYCSGGGPAVPVTFPAAKISKTGRFTTKAAYTITLGPFKGKVGDRFLMTGTFTSKGTVHGTVKTTNVTVSKCGGSSRFTAKK